MNVGAPDGAAVGFCVGARVGEAVQSVHVPEPAPENAVSQA